MKLGAVIPVLNEWRFLPAVASQLLKVVERLVIVRPSRSQSGAPVELTPIPTLDSRIDVLEGNWGSEAETRNAGLDYLDDCDYVFMVDSDEILLDQDLQTLKELCASGEHQVLAVRLFTYWKTAAFRIDPPEDGTIKMVLKKGVRLQGIREVREPFHTTEVWCRHLSYVRTDEEVKEKIRLSGHAHEMNPDWFANVWKAWDENHDLENLHPVHASAYRKAIACEDPELARILGEAAPEEAPPRKSRAPKSKPVSKAKPKNKVNSSR